MDTECAGHTGTAAAGIVVDQRRRSNISGFCRFYRDVVQAMAVERCRARARIVRCKPADGRAVAVFSPDGRRIAWSNRQPDGTYILGSQTWSRRRRRISGR